MAVQAAIPLAGKLLPLLQGITSNPAMAARITGAAAGGLPSLLSGDIPGAVLGGSFGALSTLGLGGLGQRFANPLATGAAGLLGNQGMKSVLAANVARAALPLGIGLSANAILGRGERNLASQAMGVGGGGINNAAGIIGYNAVTGEPIVGAAVPGGMGQFGGIPPYGGSALDVLNPGGPAGAQRLTTLKNAQTMADALNAYLPTVRKFSEQAKKDDFERNMASSGIKQNILTNAAMLQAAQAAGLGMGLQGATQAGQALTQQYNY
jgi:hypothetical protein